MELYLPLLIAIRVVLEIRHKYVVVLLEDIGVFTKVFMGELSFLIKKEKEEKL